MARFCIVPEKDWEVISKYISDQGGIVLVPEHVVEKFPEKQQKQLREIDECGEADYDFGGEPDTVIDFILSPDSYAAGVLLDYDDEEDET